MTRIPIALATMLAPSCSHAYDLMDAYKHARSNDPTISRFDAIKQAAREDVSLAHAPLLPRISANLNLIEKDWGETAFPVRHRHTRHRTQAITIDYRMFDISGHSRLSAAKSASRAQDATYEAALQQLATRVVTAYFEVLTNDDALAFAKANERVLDRQQEEASVRSKVGLATTADVLDARARHSTSIAAVITAEHLLADSREALSQITGKPVGRLKKLRELLPVDAPPPAYLKASVARAVAGNPSVLAARYNLESTEQGVATARAGDLPTIDAALSYKRTAAWTQTPTRSAHGNTQGRRRRSGFTIGLTLRVPIVSAVTQGSHVRRAIDQREAAQGSLELTRRRVVSDTLRYHRSVVAGVSKIAATKAEVESFKNAHHATQAGIEVGSRTIIDLLIVQQKLTRSLMDHSVARHQFILDKLLLKKADGSLGMEDLEAINLLLQ
ncbi:MAG TPA: TolC family outer membrane protein [Luteibacter sp.]|uniref:TolC family outer membrane protein n=1 Tax=Luteibacter sp. TaxID=1886636 RepID=UPI002C4AA010|nr:TolC family outer membrane protein [Luteibacter sp.]HVI54303.1 TolC family outer membrane protein [Luteibacter sp.]